MPNATETLAQRVKGRITTVLLETIGMLGESSREVEMLRKAIDQIDEQHYNGALHYLTVARRTVAKRTDFAGTRTNLSTKIARLEGYAGALLLVASDEYDGERLTIAGV